MFSLKREVLGNYENISIQNENGVGFDVIPGRGAVLHQIYANDGVGILDEFENGNDLSSNPKFKQTLLFPFPNRLEDGTYEHDGESHQFPINEAERNNSLHGMVYNMPFKEESIHLDEEAGSIRLSLNYSGAESYFPFPFQMEVTYKMTSNSIFSLSIEMINIGAKSFPYGFGWHPYFKLDEVGDYQLQMPEVRKVEVDTRFLPTGSKTIFDSYLKKKRITDSFDTCFELILKDPWKVILEGKTTRLTMSCNEDLPFIQIYNPTDQIVAIEPMTCSVNAFRTKDGLRHLKPGDEVTLGCKLEIGKPDSSN